MRVRGVSHQNALLRLAVVVLLVQQYALATAIRSDVKTIENENPSPPSISRFAAFSAQVSAAGGVLIEKLATFVDQLLLGGVDESSILDGGDGASLAWGENTLEVVKTQASYLTRPAAFGPRVVDDEGLRGKLLPISDFYRSNYTEAAKVEYNRDATLAIDNFGCPHRGGPGWHQDDDEDKKRDNFPGERLQNVEFSDAKPPSDWIALIERGGNCSFVAKVRVAQALGAKAVVVGDAPSIVHGGGNRDPGFSGRLVTMFAPGDTSDIKIPSTFVTRPSYVDLIRLVEEAVDEQREECAARKKMGKPCTNDKRGIDVILWRDDTMWEWPLVDLAFVLLMLPSFMTLITIIVHRIRLIHQRRKDRAPEVAVLNLPCLIWRGNGQPWEKVEDAAIIGGGAQGGNGRKTVEETDNAYMWHQYRARLGTWIGRFKRRSSIDMEANSPEDNGSALQLSTPDAVTGQAENGDPGPSTVRSSVPLKTVPIAPPVPPSDRTYFSFDECAICLSEFVDGDMVRVLPCGHVFHLQEIDSWLLKVKKFCPICKRDMTSSTTSPTNSANATEAASASASAAAASSAPSDEQTPLLIDHSVD